MDSKGIGTGKAVDNCTQHMRHDDVKSTQTCYLIIPPSYAHLDASMAVHVSNIVDREYYVVMCDETGTPLRPPLPPGKRKQSLPRQVGRYMVPTPLGSSLLELFGHNAIISETSTESPALLSHPSIRKQMEQEKQIARGEIEKDMCVENNLSWFEQRYSELERSLTRDRVYEFGGALMKTQEYLRYLRRLDAFEPKIDKPNKGHEPRNDTKKRSNTFSTKTGAKVKGRPNLKSQPQKKYKSA